MNSKASFLVEGLYKRPYDLLNSALYKWLFALTGSVLSFLFIVIKKPMFLGVIYSTQEVYLLGIGYSVTLTLIWVLHLFLFQKRIFKTMTFLNTLIWLAWINALTGFFNFVFAVMVLFDKEFDWYFLPEILGKSMQFGGVVALAYILIHLAKKYLFPAEA